MEDKSRLQLLHNTALISGVFCLVVSLLLLLNYLQFSSKEPLESQAMEILLEKLSEDSGNEQLKEDIRDLDMLARKAYFNSQWQIRTGSYLLLFGAIVFAVSLRYYHSLRSRIPEPEEEGKELFRGGMLTQKWILASGGVLLVAALGTSLITVNHLDNYGVISEKSTGSEASDIDENIEVIDLGSQQSSGDADPVSAAGIESGSDNSPGTETTSGTIAGATPETATGTTPESTTESTSGANAGNVSGSGSQASGSSAYVPVTRGEILSQHNSFRGPWGNGVSGHLGMPVDWDGGSGKLVKWKKKIPKPGYNSPIIWKDKLFISGADDSGQYIYCYNRNTGEIIWETETGDIPGSPSEKPRVTDDTGLAASGLCTDGSRVYAIFATGDIVCLSAAGERIWARNLGMPDNHYGHSSSLLVWDGKLFVQYDSNKGGRVLALNVMTGETSWDTRRQSGISWASPILIEHKGVFQLVLSADPIVAGYDIKTGKELWSNSCMMGEVGPSPAYAEGVIFAANEYAMMVAIDLDNPSEILWEGDEYLPEVSSPVASNGLLFIATSYGVFACYDARSGEKYWEQEYGNGFYSSPIIADGKVYALDMGGIMHVFKLSKEYALAGESSLGEKAYSTPAFADGNIYIRGEENLYCIGN